ncbi:sugar-binding protein [uncultured Psychroserpens sp.]|uniref:sugar-binding protein n=1 Tax=uncultured Psychroserpens sp. TaxID=255436 RepID=UPI00261202F1|nr:sugar-binding protein [uncultured Psychroserpens sp.]
MDVKKFGTLYMKLMCLVLCLTCCRHVDNSKQNASSDTLSCQLDTLSNSILAQDDGHFKAYMTPSPLIMDGCSKDDIWSRVDWYDMNYVWMGEPVDSVDYHGKFKLAWDKHYLYVLVEVFDDHLNPTLDNGIDNYWKGDYVEVFIDEDRSGGDHKFNHQAFAYHVSSEGHAIDKSTSEQTIFLDDHVTVARSQEGNKYLWEMAIQLYNKDFDEKATDNVPVEILKNKHIGFSIAYGDNDGNNSRENFMGSKQSHGQNNDEGYTNSSVFGSILFLE